MPEQTPENDPVELDQSAPEFKAALDEAVAKATAGLKSNRDEILEEKRSLKEELDKIKSTMAELGDLESLKAMRRRLETDEEAKLIAEGKIDEVLNRRTESMRKDSDARVEAATAKVGELETALQGAIATIAELRIGSEIDRAAAKLECAPTALRDVRRAALEVFSVNAETHEIEARNEDGVLRMGPDGKTALSPEAWLSEQKAESPHWWGPSAGGGAGGGDRGGQKGVDAKKLETMSGRSKIAAAISGGMR